MFNNKLENKNISCKFNMNLFLGGSLDPSFYSVCEEFAKLHSSPSKFHGSFSYEGYIFYLDTQDNHLKWLDEAENLEDAELVEHYAQQLLIELGFYDLVDEES